MLCVTSNDIPGWDIQRVCGEVFGVTVRSRNAFSQMGAGFKSLVGGELGGMTKQVIQSRNEAMGRLFAEAQARGGNAITAMRFDTTELGGNWSEICAYGTAVVAIPVTDEAKQTAIQLGYGRPGTSGVPQGPPSQEAPIGAAPGGQPFAPYGQAMPGQAMPGQAMPGQAMPGQAMPGQAMPGQPDPYGQPQQYGQPEQYGQPGQYGEPGRTNEPGT